jgi:alpha-ketoglutarate-dependent taurine dioxygenase
VLSIFSGSFNLTLPRPIYSQQYELGDEYRRGELGWHSDISFEPMPSDYSILKIHTLPLIDGQITGGDTLWAS